MTKTREAVHGFEAIVDLLFAYYLHAPRNQMILEDSFMQLMKNIQSETTENVSVRKLCPEWFVMEKKVGNLRCLSASIFKKISPLGFWTFGFTEII